ncbi:MAG: SPFH domain-containing protein [Candidatus Aenigmatarchaeota archaeon]
MTFFKKISVGWVRDTSNVHDLIWRIPNENFPKISEIKEVIIKEHERGVLISSGIIKFYLTPGKYSISRDISEVVWIDVSPKTCPFGIPKSSNALITADGKNIGVSGTITLKIKSDESSVRLFLTKIVAGQKNYSCDQLINWLRHGVLTSVFHDIISRMRSDEFTRINRSELNDKLLARLSEELINYGVEVSSIHMLGFAGI